jgi:hypothetical protein
MYIIPLLLIGDGKDFDPFDQNFLTLTTFSSTPSRPSVINQVQFNLQNTPTGRQSATPPSSQYGIGGMGRPSQKPPSPPLPLPPPPVANTPQQQLQQQQQVYARQMSDTPNSVYGTRQNPDQQNSIYATRQNSDAQNSIYMTRQNSDGQNSIYMTRQNSDAQNSVYASRQNSDSTPSSAIYSRQLSAASVAAAAAEAANTMYATRQANQQQPQQPTVLHNLITIYSCNITYYKYLGIVLIRLSGSH